MKTTFWRLFSNTLAILLVSFLLIGIGIYFMTSQLLFHEKKELLSKDAETVSRLLTAYEVTDIPDNRWALKIAISFTSEITDTNILLADESGTVLFCSCGTDTCSYIGSVISSELLQRSVEENGCFEYGTAGGLFETKAYAVCLPAADEASATPDFFIIAFTENDVITGEVVESTGYFLVVAFIVLVITLLSTSIISRKQTKAIDTLCKAAHDFGHGNFEARAELDNSSSVEMKELASAFNSMAVSIEKSEIQRREFVANVSHELKTPMTTIAGFMDGMLDGTIPPEQHRKYMQTVSNEVRRLSRLVRSMLEVSRIQAQGIPEEKKKRFDISEVIGRTLLTFEQKINQKRLNVEVQFPENGIAVWAEEDSITQVVYNLIDNAVKFCNEFGTLFLQIESNGQKAEISIANTGPTIDPEELPLVFDRFHKTDKSRAMDKDGAGLGLYIVKTIVASHGEDISVTSRDGVTRFTFTLQVKS